MPDRLKQRRSSRDVRRERNNRVHRCRLKTSESRKRTSTRPCRKELERLFGACSQQTTAAPLFSEDRRATPSIVTLATRRLKSASPPRTQRWVAARITAAVATTAVSETRQARRAAQQYRDWRCRRFAGGRATADVIADTGVLGRSRGRPFLRSDPQARRVTFLVRVEGIGRTRSRRRCSGALACAERQLSGRSSLRRQLAATCSSGD